MSENHAQPTIEDPVAGARAEADAAGAASPRTPGGEDRVRLPAELLGTAADCKCSTCWDGEKRLRAAGPHWLWLTKDARVVALLAIRSMGRLTKSNRDAMSRVRKAVIAGIDSDEDGRSEWVDGHVPLSDLSQVRWLQTALENITSDSYKPVVAGKDIVIELVADHGEGEEELRLKLEAMIAAHPEAGAESPRTPSGKKAT